MVGVKLLVGEARFCVGRIELYSLFSLINGILSDAIVEYIPATLEKERRDGFSQLSNKII